MAGSPKLKVYSKDGAYLAACIDPTDAAAIVSVRGEGATIRLGHAKKDVVWTEGKEAQPAGESYDSTAKVITERCQDLCGKRSARNRGRQ